MNCRPYNQNVKSILADLLTLTLETPPEVADVFFEFIAHTGKVEIRIHKGGWKSGQRADWSRTAHVDEPGSTQSLASILRDAQQFLA